ncbi:MAG: hypothetical protein L3J12_03775 [Spirochaetales bacterium]|nr:hypothetical protein [Spirochaetales bacterium]
MKKIKIISFGSLWSYMLIAVIISCVPLEDYRKIIEKDIQPPAFISMGTEDSKTLILQFSEDISVLENHILIEPLAEILSVTTQQNILKITFKNPMEPGKLFKIEITVEDLSGNSLGILSDFYGFNSNLPGIIINEFTTQGSSTNPDKVELRVLSPGNTAGLSLFEGIDTNWAQRKIIPPIEVEEGDYLVIHFKPSGTAEEVDETILKTSSGGLNVTPEAWDLWVEGGTGLSGNNGTITLFTNPGGTLIDGVLYSNRTSVSDEKYRGFGSLSVMIRADRLSELRGWISTGDFIAPEDAIDPEDSTATRSMCRSLLFTDTDSSPDWHIVPTSGSSFGSNNSDEEYN